MSGDELNAALIVGLIVLAVFVGNILLDWMQ